MKILIVSLLLLLAVGCSRPCQRFVAIGENAYVALDTKTGRVCYTTTTPDGPDLAKLPRCYDLYKGK